MVFQPEKAFIFGQKLVSAVEIPTKPYPCKYYYYKELIDNVCVNDGISDCGSTIPV